MSRAQLHMTYVADRGGAVSMPEAPEGYRLRVFQEEDAAGHIRLMKAAGFADWREESLQAALARCLPHGFFVIERLDSGALASTAMATHNPSAHFPYGGELGWVATDPAWRGMGLGRRVCAAALRRFLDSGYTNIYLRTDDERLAAVKVYLNLGFAPFLFQHDMEERWRAVCGRLGVDFDSLAAVSAPFPGGASSGTTPAIARAEKREDQE